jgi:hypothetical protein
VTDEQALDAAPMSDERRDQVYAMWALCDFWPLTGALALLLAKEPAVPVEAPDHADTRGAQLFKALALRCAGGTLPVARSEAFPGALCVRPQEFLRWADLKGVPVPGRLRMAVEDVEPLTGAGTPKRKFSEQQRHREICRGVAARLCQQHPDMTIKDMAQRPELREIGCEGSIYTHDTIYDWIKEKAPNRRPGHRPTTPKPPARTYRRGLLPYYKG